MWLWEWADHCGGTGFEESRVLVKDYAESGEEEEEEVEGKTAVVVVVVVVAVVVDSWHTAPRGFYYVQRRGFEEGETWDHVVRERKERVEVGEEEEEEWKVVVSMAEEEEEEEGGDNGGKV